MNTCRQSALRGWLRLMLLLGMALCLGCEVNRVDAGEPSGSDGFLLFDGPGMAEVKQKLAAGDPHLNGVLKGVVDKAEHYLTVAPVSVTDKPMTPPSGDKHDYMSMSPYWWPNPDTADGKPYLRRDGEYNPERADYDVPKLDTVTNAVRFLAIAYYFTGDERYAEHAAKHLKHFYINPETKMNPGLPFGQFVPGVAENGRKSGIIESIRMRFLVDSITMLRGSKHWSDEDHAAMKQWFGDFVHWLKTSDHGMAEAKTENNHGSWYAQQVVLYSLFAGDEATALEAIKGVPARIDAQYEPDGNQPHENKRTRSLHYCDFNNRAMMDIARLAERLGVDLWGYESADGRSVRRSLEFMVPYMVGEKEWPHKQIDKPRYEWFAQSFRWAGIGFDEPEFEAMIQKLPDGFEANAWIELVVPAKD